MRMAVLAAVRKSETSRIVETTGSAVNYFSDERQRLQRSRTKLLEEQQLGKVVQIFFIGDGEQGAETFQVDVSCLNFMVRRHAQVTCCLNCLFRVFVCNLEQCGLCTIGSRINQVHDRTLILTDNSR